MRLKTLLTALVVLAAAVFVWGCGSSASDRPPTTAAVIRCLKHGGTGGRVYSEEAPDKIGGLPAHVGIEMAGFTKGLRFGVIEVDIFESGAAGEEARERLEDEGRSPMAIGNGTVIPVVSKGPLRAKNEALAIRCGETG